MSETPTKTVPVTFRVTEEMRDRLQVDALARGLSLSEYLRATAERSQRGRFDPTLASASLLLSMCHELLRAAERPHGSSNVRATVADISRQIFAILDDHKSSGPST